MKIKGKARKRVRLVIEQLENRNLPSWLLVDPGPWAAPGLEPSGVGPADQALPSATPGKLELSDAGMSNGQWWITDLDPYPLVPDRYLSTGDLNTLAWIPTGVPGVNIFHPLGWKC
jgi:hypothetical protein